MWYFLSLAGDRLFGQVATQHSAPLRIEATTRACSPRNKENYKTAIYFFRGGLDLYPRNT
jgi:hypothetical protein